MKTSLSTLDVDQLAPGATPIESSLSNYAQLLQWRAREFPDKLAYTFLANGERIESQYTYLEFDTKVRALSSRLLAQGAAGQRVLIVLPSDLNFSISFLACLYSRAAAVTTVPPTTEEQLRRLNGIAQDAEAQLVVSTRRVIERVSGQLKDCPTLRTATWIAVETVEDHLAQTWQEPETTWDDLALLQYTSGSTSDPKGVMITHRNLARIGAAHETLFGVTAQDIGVSWIPQSHDMGLIFGVLQPLYTGFPLYLMTPMAFLKKPIRWLRAISTYRATASITPNFAYDMCVETVRDSDFDELDLSTFTLAANGAEPIRKSTYDRFTECFRRAGFQGSAFSSAYGMAETTLAVSVGSRGEPYRSRTVDVDMLESGIVLDSTESQRVRDLVSCGTIAPSVEIEIVNPESLATLPRDHVGEILIRGDLVGLGYWQNAVATHEIFEIYTEDGRGPFLRTGDLGFIDHQGELYISGRAKDVIIIQGKNHAPQDLELTVEITDAAIRPRQVAAFSIESKPSEAVVIIAELDKRCPTDTDPTKVGRKIAQKVASEHQVPVCEVVFVKRGQCPKTTSGKIQRQRAKALYQNKEFTVAGRYSNPLFQPLA